MSTYRSKQGDWIYQNASEAELREYGKEALQASKCSASKKNIDLIENEIYKLALTRASTPTLNRKKYACLLQEFIRDACYIKEKTVQDIYKMYQAANRSDETAPIGWQSSLFDEAREQEDIEIQNLLRPPEPIEPGAIPCRRCKSLNTRSTSAQIRRSDESATDFFSCFNCKYTWRE